MDLLDAIESEDATRLPIHRNVDTGFQTELQENLRRYRAAIEQLLVELGSPATPRILERKLSIPYTLCWRVFQVVGEHDGLSSARHAPTPTSLRALLVGAVAHGVDPAVTTAVEQAAKDFQRFVKSHADDQASFGALVAGIGQSDSGECVGMQQRRDAYRNLSHIWGRQIETAVNSRFVKIGKKAGTSEECYLSLRAGVRRLRADTPLLVYGTHVAANGVAPASDDRPLDVEANSSFGIPIIPRFSSNPIPKFVRTQHESGWQKYWIVGNEVGLRSSTNFTFGEHCPEVLSAGNEHGTPSHWMAVKVPTAMLVMDWLLYRPDFGNKTPELVVCETPEGPVTESSIRDQQKLPLDEQIVALGRADQAGGISNVPEYRQMLHYAADKLNWNLADFDLYRVRVPFPVVGSVTRLFLATD